MKLFKKLVAATAMASVCFTMTTPVSASAMACKHIMTKVSVDEDYSYDKHDYYYLADYNENGIMETVKGKCTYLTVTETYEYRCLCGILNDGVVKEVTVVHLYCGK